LIAGKIHINQPYFLSIAGYQLTPTLKTPKVFKPRASTLTPAFNQLRLATGMLSPLNETLFQSCLEDDNDMMLSAIDSSTPQP
jgi:hypothetical protein